MQIKTYPLIAKANYINPEWINAFMHTKQHGIVDDSGLIEIKGEHLGFTETPLPTGTEVIVTIGRYFSCYQKSELLAMEKQTQLEEARRTEIQRLESISRRKKAEQHNNSLNIPVRWNAAIKEIITGSINDIKKSKIKTPVIHVCVSEKLKDGRFVREAGEFLCGESSAKEWAPNNNKRDFDADGVAYKPSITCKACVKAAQRWAINSK